MLRAPAKSGFQKSLINRSTNSRADRSQVFFIQTAISARLLRVGMLPRSAASLILAESPERYHRRRRKSVALTSSKRRNQFMIIFHVKFTPPLKAMSLGK